MIEAAALDSEKVLVAFMAGIAYHDALMRYCNEHPDERNTFVSGARPDAEEMDAALHAWHNTIAAALEVEP